MNRRITYIFFLVFFAGKLFAQVNFKGQMPHQRLFNLRDVYDSTYGIQYFDKYCPAMGGDSVRKSPEGYASSGWVEDHYTNGAVIHKGFYADGQLTMYTNYYPNGQVERDFKLVTERKTELKKYYPDGKLKSDVVYFDGNSMDWHDYFPNGQVQYVEEYDKKHERLMQRCSYFSNGKPLSLFVPMSDKKPYHYSKKEYYDNGQIKEDEVLVYSEDDLDFIKDGEDKQYDNKGTLVSDVIYLKGEIDKTIK